MIKTREQRKASSLLRRRKIAILIAVILVAILGVVLFVVQNYIDNVIPYYDVDDTEYHIKQIDGVYVMCDKDGNILPTDSEFGYYILDSGSLILLDPETGEVKERVIPEHYDPDLSETVEYEKILIFPNISGADVKSVTVFNSYEPEGFSIERYNLDEMKTDMSSDFVLRYKKQESTLLSLQKDLVSSMYVSAGYALATGKIEPAKVEEFGYEEYGLEAETRTRTGWFYRIVITVDGTEHVINVNVADGAFLSEETVKDSIEPTYDMTAPSEGISVAKGVMLATNTLDISEESKVKYTVSLRSFEETYEYKPTRYIIESGDGQKHGMIIGDRLIDGNGYYAQYVNVETSERRDSVYILPASIADTLLAPAKTLVAPQIAYPTSTNDYFDVTDFAISAKTDDGYEEKISFSYIDIALRTDTVEGIHPYEFPEGDFEGYRPNYDSIDVALVGLMDPTINEIAVLSPTAADKIAYGLAKAETYDENGNIKTITYNSKYKISFYRTHTDDAGKKTKFLQTMYVSEKNADGNYYVYTVIDFPAGKLSLDMICEVSDSTMGFVEWDSEKWVYPEYLQIGIVYVDKITVTMPDYSIDFDVDHTEVDDATIMDVAVKDSKGNDFSTFGYLDFKDRHGNRWVISSVDIKVYDSAGNEIKPTSRHYEYNSIGEQVRVIDEQITAEDGRRIRVTKDYIEIIYPDNTREEHLRHHESLFRSLFLLTTNMSIIDSYKMSDEEEAALLSDPSKFVASVKLIDTDGNETTVEYYALTARKMYIVVNGSGGFYVSTAHVNKSLEAIDKFLNKEYIDTEY